MKVGVDVRCFAGGKTTGVEEYTKSFLEALFSVESEHEFILFFNAYKDVDIDFSWAEEYDHVRIESFHYPNKALNLSLWYLRFPKIDRLLSEKVDVFFLPNPTFFAISGDVPFIVTVHDLSCEYYEEYFSWKQRVWHWMVNVRDVTRRASRVVAVSASTKNDLMMCYGTDPEKILLLPNGPTQSVGDLTRNSPSILAIKEKYKLPFEFILFFGTIEPRKNLASLILAYDLIRDKHSAQKHKLVLAGSRGWRSRDVYDVIESSAYKEDIVVINDVTRFERDALYVLSDVFVYPSLYEGFGFPPLEALRAGTPVITSHNSSLSEVVEDHAVMIDPTRPEEIYQAMRFVIGDKFLKADLVNERVMSEYVRSFSWKKNVDRFLDTLQQIHK